MRYPYERFLRFLVSRKANLNLVLGRYGLPAVGGLWVADYRSHIRKSAPYSVKTYLSSEEEAVEVRDGFLEWAESEGFRELWEAQDEFGGRGAPELEASFQIFVNPKARGVVGMLLFSGDELGEVAKTINDRFDLEVSVAVLEVYQKIFWDSRNVDRDRWPDIIAALKSEEERHYLSLGLSSPSPGRARHEIGAETTLDPEYVLDRIIANAYYQHEASMEHPCPEAAGAIRWAELALKAINAKRTAGKFGPNETDMLPTPENFQGMFSVQVTKSQHVSLSDLKGELSTSADAAKSPETD